MAAGAVLILVAALASYASFSSLGNTVTVVVTTSAISKGETLQAAHLGSLEIAGGQATSAIPATEAHLLIGQFATTDLVAGSLVTRDAIRPALPISPGFSVVGVALTTSQLPSTQLHAGDRIRIVSTPIAQAEPPSNAPETVAATVFAVRNDERAGMVIVDVIVPSAAAADVAARAATGRIAVVLDGTSES